MKGFSRTPPWLSRQTARVAGRHVLLLRVSFAGELGWEIHADNEDMPAIYDAVQEAGAKPFGMWALNSLRLEKGYRAWKGDLSTDYSLLEGGLDRFVRLDKPQDFPGKAAILNEKQQGVKKRFVTQCARSCRQARTCWPPVTHRGPSPLHQRAPPSSLFSSSLQPTAFPLLTAHSL